MIYFQVDIGRSTPRQVQVRPDGIALQWAVCGSGCSGCSSARWMIVDKLEAKGIEYHPFDKFLVIPHNRPEQSVEQYLSEVLDYPVERV